MVFTPYTPPQQTYSSHSYAIVPMGTHQLPPVRFFTTIAFPVDTHTTDIIPCHDNTKGHLILNTLVTLTSFSFLNRILFEFQIR